MGNKGSERVRLCDVFLEEAKKYNPYSSRDEYNRREKRFLEEQSKLFELLIKSGTLNMPAFVIHVFDGKLAERVDHDLTNAPMTGLLYLMGPKQFLELTLAERIFGDLWIKKGEEIAYKEDDKEIIRNLERKEYLFEAGRVFFMKGVVKNEELKINAAYSLKKEHLTEQGIMECAKKAFDLYDIFEFSDIHYRKLNKINPLSPFLEEIIEIVIKLDRNKLPNKFYEGKVIGFFEGNEYVPPGLSVENPKEPGFYLILTNCQKHAHKDIVKPGDKVRYTVHPLNMADMHYSGKLIDILN